jgi:succinate dehydrogenase/fumarate reductase flavoprotein subunit
LFQFALRKGLLDRSDILQDMMDGQAMPNPALFGSFAHSSEDVVWDEEVDVIVVGSGTGLLAAVQAADAGLRVLVLEKANVVGGTTGISGGGLWIPNNFRMQEAGIEDSFEEALEYIHHATFGQADPDLARTFVENCNPAIDFLRQTGIDWVFMPTFNDYHPHFPGGKPRGRSLRPVTPEDGEGDGGMLVRWLAQAAVQRGVKIHLNVAARQLVVDEVGAVVGVIATNRDHEVKYKALGGVVLAAGGFDHNQAMVNNFLRGPLYYTNAVPTNTGDGHLMGMALGAGLRHMNERWGWPVFYDPQQKIAVNALAHELGKPGAIVVNKKGQRILNEAGPYDAVVRAFYYFDTGTYAYANIPSYVILDSGHRQRYSIASFPPGANLPKWITKADTLDKLASLLDIEAPALQETVKRFNRYAELGYDPDFRRGESDFDIITGGDTSRQDLSNPCMAPLVEPPFYGMLIWPGALGTSGGLHISCHSQVLNVWGKVIPGLYAVGNTAGSPLGGGYPGGGGTLSAGLTFAFIAANHIIQTLASSE